MYKTLEDIKKLEGTELDNSTGSIIALSGDELIEAAQYFFTKTTNSQVTKDHLRIIFKLISEQTRLKKQPSLELDPNVKEALSKRLDDLQLIDPNEDFSTTVRLENGKKISEQQSFFAMAKAAALERKILRVITNENYSMFTNYFDHLTQLKMQSTDFVDLFKHANTVFFNNFISKILLKKNLSENDSTFLTHLLFLKNILDPKEKFFPYVSQAHLDTLFSIIQDKITDANSIDQIIHALMKATLRNQVPQLGKIDNDNIHQLVYFYQTILSNVQPSLSIETSLHKEGDGLVLVAPLGGGFDGLNAANFLKLLVSKGNFVHENIVMMPLRSEITGSQTTLAGSLGAKRTLENHGGELTLNEKPAGVFKINGNTKMSAGRFSENKVSEHFPTYLAVYPKEGFSVAEQFEAGMHHFEEENKKKITKIIVTDTGGDIALGNRQGPSQDWDGLQAIEEIAAKLGIPYEVMIIAPGIDSPNSLNFLEIQALSDAKYISLSGEKAIKEFNDQNGLDGSRDDFYSKTGYIFGLATDPKNCGKIQRIDQMPVHLGNHDTNPWELYTYIKDSMAGVLWIRDGHNFFQILNNQAQSYFTDLHSIAPYADIFGELTQVDIQLFHVEIDYDNSINLNIPKMKELFQHKKFGFYVGNIDENMEEEYEKVHVPHQYYRDEILAHPLMYYSSSSSAPDHNNILEANYNLLSNSTIDPFKPELFELITIYSSRVAE